MRKVTHDSEGSVLFWKSLYLFLHNFEVCGKESIVLFDTKLGLIFLNSNISGYVKVTKNAQHYVCD